MSQKSKTEFETYDCCFCGQPIETEWMADGSGMITEGKDHTLMADWVAHHDCVDKSFEEYEQSQPSST